MIMNKTLPVNDDDGRSRENYVIAIDRGSDFAYRRVVLLE